MILNRLMICLAVLGCVSAARGSAGEPASTWEEVKAAFAKLGARHSDFSIDPVTREKIHAFIMPRRCTDTDLKSLPRSPYAFSLVLRDTKVTDAGLTELKGLINLTRLDLSYTEITDEGLVALKGLTNLTELRLSGTEVSDDGLKSLAQLANLTSLDLAGTKVSDVGLADLKGLNKLTLLELSESEVTDDALANLREIGLLHSLWIAELERGKHPSGTRPKNEAEVVSFSLLKTEVTDRGLKELKGLKNLTRLVLNDKQVTDVGLATLREIGLLHTLGSSQRGSPHSADQVTMFSLKKNVTPLGLLELREFKNLNTIGLAGRHEVQDETLAALNKIGKLHALWIAESNNGDRPADLSEVLSIDLTGTNVTDRGLSLLKVYPNLAKLNLHGRPVTDAGMEHVGELTNLTWLNLVQTKVTDEGLKQLNGLTKLQYLRLPDGVTGVGIKELKGLAQLSQLDIRMNDQLLAALREQGLHHVFLGAYGQGRTRPATDADIVRMELGRTRVSDTGLKELEGLSNLRYLELNDTQVTKAGIEDFIKALPECQIRR